VLLATDSARFLEEALHTHSQYTWRFLNVSRGVYAHGTWIELRDFQVTEAWYCSKK
jgi:hypothetical protein